MSKPDCLRPKGSGQNAGYIQRLVAEGKLDCSKIKCPSPAIEKLCAGKKPKLTNKKIKLTKDAKPKETKLKITLRKAPKEAPKERLKFTVPKYDSVESTSSKDDIKNVFVYLYGIYRNKGNPDDPKLEEIFRKLVDRGIIPKKPILAKNSTQLLTRTAPPGSGVWGNILEGLLGNELKKYQSSRTGNPFIEDILKENLFDKIKRSEG